MNRGGQEVERICEGVLRGEPRAVARAMRWVDDDDPRAQPLLRRLYPHTGRAYVLGVTGTPGAGKSTLVDRIVSAWRERDERVGVVAVDPSSPITGGALLGDRIRMERHFTDPDVFIRSLATRGHLGGLSRSASDVTRILDAAGYGVVLVETVGVGQDELEVARLAHTTLLVLAPGLGDDIQAIKAGILEVADVYVVNKADRPGADATVTDVQQMLALGGELSKGLLGPGHAGAAAMMGRRGLRAPSPPSDPRSPWTPPVVKTVASRGEGIEELLAHCRAHREWLQHSGQGRVRAERRLAEELRERLQVELWREAVARLAPDWAEEARRLADGERDPYGHVRTWVERLLGEGPSSNGSDPSAGERPGG